MKFIVHLHFVQICDMGLLRIQRSIKGKEWINYKFQGQSHVTIIRTLSMLHVSINFEARSLDLIIIRHNLETQRQPQKLLDRLCLFSLSN